MLLRRLCVLLALPTPFAGCSLADEDAAAISAYGRAEVAAVERRAVVFHYVGSTPYPCYR